MIPCNVSLANILERIPDKRQKSVSFLLIFSYNNRKAADLVWKAILNAFLWLSTILLRTGLAICWQCEKRVKSWFYFKLVVCWQDYWSEGSMRWCFVSNGGVFKFSAVRIRLCTQNSDAFLLTFIEFGILK